jgi:hypothetical protein
VSDRKLTKPIASATTHILLITAILIVSLVILFSNPKITGRYFAPAETFSAPISEKFTSNSNYSFEIPQEKPYNLKALKISGSFTGEGTAKVYLKTENETYLVFDSSTLTKNSASVSGLVTGALTDVLGNSPLSSSSDGSSAQPASPPSSEQANAQEGSIPDTTGQGGAGADNSAPAGEQPPAEAPPQEQPPAEQPPVEAPVNETQPTENQTTNPENITNQTQETPLNQTQELTFADKCEETCILPDGLADNTYTLEIQVENGELSISEIKYSLQNLTDIPVNITIAIVDSKGEPVAANIALIDDSGASVAEGTAQGQTIANEIFSQPAQGMPSEGTNSFEAAPSDQNNLVVDVQTASVPIQKIEFNNIDATTDINAVIGVDDVPNTIGPPGQLVAETYAIDPTQLDFATATVTVEASPTSTALYKCASWDFDQQVCTDGNWTFVQSITPGMSYEITLTQGDPAYSETQQPNGAGKETYIVSGFPNANYGASQTMDIMAADTRRSLIQFNLSNITSNAQIISATMKLYVIVKGTGDQVVDVRRLTRAWDEGTGTTGQITNDGATWNNATNTTLWTTAGGDMGSIVWATATITSASAYFNWDVKNLVQNWVNGTYPNYGMILNISSGSGTTTFATGDNTDSAKRPILEVNWTTPLNITFVSPTPSSGNTTANNWVYVNASLINGPATEAKLEWNGTNYTMTNASALPSSNWYLNKTSLTNGNYTYKVYANDSGTNVFDVSETRTVTVNYDGTPPTIQFVSPTLNNGSTTSNNWIYMNVSSSDANTHYALLDWNSSVAGWWRLETNGTSFADDSGNNNNGTCSGSICPNYTLSGVFGGAYTFDGVDDRIILTDSTTLKPSNFTISGWFKTSYGSGNQMLFLSGAYTGNAAGFSIHINPSFSNKLRFIIGNSSSTYLAINSLNSVNNGNWHFFAATYNSTHASLYIDGVKENTTAWAYPPIYPSPNYVRMGDQYGSTFFNGSMDEVMMFKRALSSSEISSLYNATANQYYNNFTNLSVGNYAFKAYAVDTAGNKNNTEIRTITYNSDSTPPTVTIIRPENTTYNTQSNIPLNYTATDNVAISACWYAMNGGTNTSLPSCSNATFSTGIDGSYPITVYANDTNGNVGSAVQYFTVDTTAPQWSSPNTNAPATYSSSTLSLFNITWTGGASTVLFESNYTGTAQNYSMYLISGNIYGYNATLPAGTFYWKSYANDSAGNLNASSTQTFTINPAAAIVNLTLNDVENNITITYPQTITAVFSTNAGTAVMYRDGTSISAENNTAITLGAGYYNYTVTNPGSANYTGSSKTFFVTVNKATPTLSLLIDGVADNKTIIYGTQSNATASESNSGDSDLTYNLYRNDISISNPDVQTLGANSYVYTYNTSGGENYTSAALSRTLTVNKAATDVRLFLNGNEGNNSQAYGTNSNATATIDVAGLAFQFYRDGNPISNPEITTLAAGTYNYTATFGGNENYTGDAQTYFLTINKATPTLSLLINGEDSDLSVAAFTIASINASATTPGGATVSLYENNSLIGSGASPSASRNYTTLGNRIWKVNITESQNYTSTEKNHTLSVTDPDLPQYSSLKESPTDPAAYYPTHSYQFNATWTDNIAISDVILEFAGTNYSYLAGQLNKSGNEYYKSFSSLAAATYNYKWYANDTSNNWASTPVETYTIDKAIAALFLTLTPSNSINYGTTSTVSCSANNLESSPALTRNMSSVSNPDAGILAVGSYNYACTAAATQNYTSASATTTLTVSKATPTINLTLSGADSDITLAAGGGNVEIIATLITPDSGNLNLTQDGTPVNSGASPLANTSSFTSAGTYTLLASYAGNNNYTSGSKSHSITVQVASQPPPSGGGSTGGGTIIKNATNNITLPVTPPTSQLEKITKTIALQYGKSFTFTVNNESHAIQATAITGDFVELEIMSSVIRPQIKVNETKTFDLTNDGITDLEVTLLSKTESGITLRITVWNEVTTSAESTYIPEYKPEPLSGSAVQVMPYKAPNPLYAVPTLLLLVLLFTILAIRKENLSERVKKMLTGLHIALIITIVVLLIFTFVKTPVAGSAIAIPTVKMTIPANTLLIGISAFLVSLTIFVLVWLLHLRSHSGKKPKL